jgi:GDP-L-fucose synthase
MRRFHEAVRDRADEVVCWGSGTPKREFMHVDDMAAASVFVMNLPDDTYKAHTRPMLSHINAGTGKDCTIRELAETMARVTGFRGRLVFDSSKPDGAPRKLLDVSRLKALGWEADATVQRRAKIHTCRWSGGGVLHEAAGGWGMKWGKYYLTNQLK